MNEIPVNEKIQDKIDKLNKLQEKEDETIYYKGIYCIRKKNYQLKEFGFKGLNKIFVHFSVKSLMTFMDELIEKLEKKEIDSN